jgi:hypothetical protein
MEQIKTKMWLRSTYRPPQEARDIFKALGKILIRRSERIEDLNLQ